MHFNYELRTTVFVTKKERNITRNSKISIVVAFITEEIIKNFDSVVQKYPQMINHLILPS